MSARLFEGLWNFGRQGFCRQPASGGDAKSLRLQARGKPAVTDGPCLETKEHVGGFRMLELADMESALEWGRKAPVACRAPLEVRPLYAA